MEIKWNKVTWYSRWASFFVFLALIPIICFYIGIQYQQTTEAIVHERTTDVEVK